MINVGIFSFSFASLWFSGLGSGLSLVNNQLLSTLNTLMILDIMLLALMMDFKNQNLDYSTLIPQVIAQYTAFKIQHEHDMTLTQRSPEYGMTVICINISKMHNHGDNSIQRGLRVVP